MIFKLVAFSAFIAIALPQDDKKWAWKNGERSAKAEEPISRSDAFSQDSSSKALASPRYEVFEGGEPGGAFGYRPEYSERPSRPPAFGQGAGFIGGPFPSRPGQGLFNPSRPLGGYGQGGFGPGRPFPQNHPGVLTGPSFSSGQKPFKYFDTCKCAERFNCNTPGVAYGHCDVGKQYCCYSRNVGPPPSRPVHSPENGILVGPGGPVDGPGIHPSRPQYPLRETYDGSPYENDNGILVGPGGPTGIIGRPNRGPVSSRPIHSAANGILVGPGGPFDAPLGGPGSFGLGYGRSAKKD